MIIAELPVDEELRLADLESYDIMDSALENDFDELVELAGQICKAPISLISLMDKDRQWFKAKKGLQEKEAPRDLAFCAHAILQEGVMEVPDATTDTRFFDNPFVTGDLNVRFYAGAPIVSEAGHKLGTLCVIDTKPRHLTAAEERALTILSNQVTKLLELRKKNILIRKRAEEIIALKSKVIDNVIQQKEEDKKAISFKLHEGLAQSMASGMIFLNMALKENPRPSPHMQTAKEQFKAVLTGIRNLSYDITPPAVSWIPAEELVQEFVEKIAGTFSFTIQFSMAGKKSTAYSDKAIIVIRIIEQWLKVLADKEGVTSVHISLHTGRKFELLVEDDGVALDFEILRTRVFESSTFDIAQPQGGRIDLSVSRSGKNIFKLELPLVPVIPELVF
jgi:hypothetical protein